MTKIFWEAMEEGFLETPHIIIGHSVSIILTNKFHFSSKLVKLATFVRNKIFWSIGFEVLPMSLTLK